MHDTILGFFEPNDRDNRKNICTECFGTTTNILNGKKECRSWHTNTAGADRASYFTELCDFFGANCSTQTEQELNCNNQSFFHYGNTGAVFSDYIAPHWTDNKCYVVEWRTDYSVYNTNDYKRCVCDKWDAGNPDCL
jgi:hypothetical protein